MAKNTVPIIATSQAIVGKGDLKAILVNSHSSGTLKLIDSPNNTTGRLLTDTITFAAGPQVLDLFGIEYYEGVHAVVGGTANIELIFQPR
jgi:hypothetical protein